MPSGGPTAQQFWAVSRSPGLRVEQCLGLTLAPQILMPADVGLGERTVFLFRAEGRQVNAGMAAT